jgi:hypothetical protein
MAGCTREDDLTNDVYSIEEKVEEYTRTLSKSKGSEMPAPSDNSSTKNKQTVKSAAKPPNGGEVLDVTLTSQGPLTLTATESPGPEIVKIPDSPVTSGTSIFQI